MPEQKLNFKCNQIESVRKFKFKRPWHCANVQVTQTKQQTNYIQS